MGQPLTLGFRQGQQILSDRLQGLFEDAVQQHAGLCNFRTPFRAHLQGQQPLGQVTERAAGVFFKLRHTKDDRRLIERTHQVWTDGQATFPCFRQLQTAICKQTGQFAFEGARPDGLPAASAAPVPARSAADPTGRSTRAAA